MLIGGACSDSHTVETGVTYEVTLTRSVERTRGLGTRRVELSAASGARILAWTCEGEIVESTADADGVAKIAFEPEPSCWNLSAVDSVDETNAVSVLGIQGPLEAEVLLGREELAPFDPDDYSPISGTIQGAPSQGSHSVTIVGTGVFTASGIPGIGVTGGSFSGLYDPNEILPTVELLALELDDAIPVNAALVSVPRSGAPISGIEIDFPALPPRIDLEITFHLPQSGSFFFENPPLPSAALYRRLPDQSSVKVGHATSIDSDATAVTVEVTSLDLEDARGTHLFLDVSEGDPALSPTEWLQAWVSPEDDQLTIVPVKHLEATHAQLSSPSARLGDEAHFGTLLIEDNQFERVVRWSLHGYSKGLVSLDELPPLPEGVSLDTLGIRPEHARLVLVARGGAWAPPWSVSNAPPPGSWLYRRGVPASADDE